MDFGAHLPLMDFGGNPYTLEHLTEYTNCAARLGFSAVNEEASQNRTWWRWSTIWALSLERPNMLAPMEKKCGKFVCTYFHCSHTL